MSNYRKFLLLTFVYLLSKRGKIIFNCDVNAILNSSTSEHTNLRSASRDSLHHLSPSLDTTTEIASNNANDNNNNDNNSVVVDSSTENSCSGCTGKDIFLGIITFGIYTCCTRGCSCNCNSSDDKDVPLKAISSTKNHDSLQFTNTWSQAKESTLP